MQPTADDRLHPTLLSHSCPSKAGESSARWRAGWGLAGRQPERGCGWLSRQLPPLEVPCPVGLAATLPQALTLCRPFPHNKKQHQCILAGFGVWASHSAIGVAAEGTSFHCGCTVEQEEFCSFSGDPAPSGPRNELSQEATGPTRAPSRGHGHKGSGGRLGQRMHSSHLTDGSGCSPEPFKCPQGSDAAPSTRGGWAGAGRAASHGDLWV